MRKRLAMLCLGTAIVASALVASRSEQVASRPVSASATPAPEPTPAPKKCDEGRVVCLLKKYWKDGKSQPAALRVAKCESRYEERAISRTNDYGVFQINRASHSRRVASFGYDWDDMLDAGRNTRVAEDIFRESGWGPWRPSRSCHGQR